MNLTGLQARREVKKWAAIAKQQIVGNDLPRLQDTYCYLSDLRDFADSRKDFFLDKYFEEEENKDANFTEAWRFEKAYDAVIVHIERIDERVEILETRVARKLEESKMRRGVA
ncbi:MAG: hypothetical protein F6K14_11730 [Symploca sp. SIO2C1]|nr:hypothetical protein [Symploca sp. SIO2C1]